MGENIVIIYTFLFNNSFISFILNIIKLTRLKLIKIYTDKNKYIIKGWKGWLDKIPNAKTFSAEYVLIQRVYYEIYGRFVYVKGRWVFISCQHFKYLKTNLEF